MSMDLTKFIRNKTANEIGGKTFTFHELTLRNLAEFRADLVKQREELNKVRRQRIIEDAKAIGNIEPMELLKLTDT